MKSNADNIDVTAEIPQTIGIPSIADANLADKPTTESPAIIQGAAVGYENKTGAVEYEAIKKRDAPYSEFKYTILEEKGQDGTVHKKLSGFDGTYVITRINVADLFKDNRDGYLHVKQDDNKALLVAIGMVNNTFVGTLTTAPEGSKEYQAGSVYKTGSYKLSDMYDTTGADTTNPYLDVILFATAANVAGADAEKVVLAGDVPLHFYVDNTADYNPSLKYDPQSTDPNHAANCLAKFWDSTKAAANLISHYLVKGSDLALETMVENSGGTDGTATTYWSLQKSLEKPYYDQEIDKSADDSGCGRIAKLMSEVAITKGIKLRGTEDNLRKRTLDVNSFDIQIATNTNNGSETPANTFDSFVLDHAWLTIADKSKTTGAEFAIGNNASMQINKGGKLIIDETCQLEIEWDGATTTTGATTDTLNNGILDLNAGGEIVNNGVITIEGTEDKPYQPGMEQQAASEKGYGEFMVEPDAKLTNNGTLLVYGRLYNLGTLVNNGKYDDLLVSNDPDKGMFAYHRGIQVSWKDDITQPNVTMGELRNGQSRDGKTVVEAILYNTGDILLAPGKLVNYGTLINERNANIYLAAAEEAIIPIETTAAAPTIVSKRITLDPAVASIFENHGILINNGDIMPASVEILDNTGFGKLTAPGNHPELFNFVNFGIVVNNGFIWGWPVAHTVPASANAYSLSATSLPATGDTEPLWTLVLALIAACMGATLIAATRKACHHQ